MADVIRDGVAAYGELRPAAEVKFPVRVPPAWTRLEPQSLTGDPQQALTARVHDPLWLLARQWQFGEFDGEDAGTPVAVELGAKARLMSALTADGQDAIPLSESDLVEPMVEAEPSPAETLRTSAEAGALLAAVLNDAGVDLRAALRAACPLAIPAVDAPETLAPMWDLVGRTGIDPGKAAADIEDGSFTGSWASGAGADAEAAARAWLGWYRLNMVPGDATIDAWEEKRLEYRFSVRAGPPDDAVVCRAPAHNGGPVDWYSFDHVPGESIEVDDEEGGTGAQELSATVHATRLRYSGMPASRLWQLEDGQVNFGMVEVQPHDVARMAFLEFAAVHADDWLVAPLDVPLGSLVEMTKVAYRTTFDETFAVGQGNTGRGGFELFTLAAPANQSLRALVVPAGRSAMDGPALEEVVFARDETANLVWAIEKTVQGAAGEPRDRSLEGQPADEFHTLDDADLTYRLETVVPPWWIPMVPVPKGARGGFELRKGTLTGTDHSRGRILEGKPVDLFEEEVPREGVLVRRVPAILRDKDGTIRRWITRRVSVARGEANSAIAWDNAVRR